MKLIMEEDQTQACDYDAIKSQLFIAGFKLIENEDDRVWRSVWQK